MEQHTRKSASVCCSANQQAASACERAHKTHLQSPHVTSRHTVHHTLSTSPRRPVGHAHIERSSGKSRTYERNKAEHDAHWHTWGILGRHAAKRRQRFLPMTLAACSWRIQCEEPRYSIDEVERAHDLRALLHRRQRHPVGAESKRYRLADKVIGP